MDILGIKYYEDSLFVFILVETFQTVLKRKNATGSSVSNDVVVTLQTNISFGVSYLK